MRVDVGGSTFRAGKTYTKLRDIKTCMMAPCVMVSSTFDIEPGFPVKFISKTQVVPSSRIHCHGISDPFLETGVAAGRAFFVFVNSKHAESVMLTFEITGVPAFDIPEEAVARPVDLDEPF